MAQSSRQSKKRSLARKALAWVRNVVAVRRQRRDLDALEPHLLDDIGITARDARAEAQRKPWDLPLHVRASTQEEIRALHAPKVRVPSLPRRGLNAPSVPYERRRSDPMPPF